MKLLQTYYTSCRVGQTGNSGFQFYSYSDGLSQEELNEIGRLGGYQAPYGSNPSPTEEEVLSILPVAFKYFRLSSGRVGVLQSTACTQEYTGRPGNFFTHALILEQGEFPFMPILLHKSKYLLHDLTEEQKAVSIIPSLLPTLSLVNEADFAYQKFDDVFIRQFIRQGNNEDMLSKLLDIILTCKNVQKRIIIADDRPEEIIYALSRILPAQNIADFTFSTYSLYPQSQGLVFSASRREGSDLDFDDTRLGLSYYVFDHSNGRYPELEEQSEFSKVLVRLFATQPQRVKELYQYAENFNDTGGHTDLVATIFEGGDFSSAWKQIIPFVAGEAKPEYVESFLSEHIAKIEDLSGVLKDEDDIILFFEDILKLIHRSPNLPSWFKQLYLCYLSLIGDRLESPAKSLMEFNARILSVFNGQDREMFRERFLARDSFSFFAKQAHSELAVVNVFILIIVTVRMLAGSLKRVPGLFNTEVVKWFVDYMNKNNISSDLFNFLISEAPDEAGLLLTGISEAGGSDLVGRIIEGFEKDALTHIPTNAELQLYKQLKPWITTKDHTALSLALSDVDGIHLVERMKACGYMQKMAVLLEWKKRCFEQNGDIRPLISLIEFLHDKSDERSDDLLRKIIATLNRSAHNALKLEMEQRQGKVRDYFLSLNKTTSLKRLFNFKF